MHDPFPIPRPDGLLPYVQPVADFLNMKTLPLHFHEVLLAFTLYHSINRFVAPALSQYLFPRIYPTFNARTKLNWDVHVVSFVQSTLICGLALWVLTTDEELRAMDTTERVHGYTGASGLIQAFAGGYFLWDLVITVQNVRIFGVGMLLHAISALCVFSLGFVSSSLTYTSILYRLVSLTYLPTYPTLSPMNVTNTNMSTAPLRKLLRLHLHPLRTLLPLPQHPLVLRQTKHDRHHAAAHQRPRPAFHVLLLPYPLGHIPICPGLPRRVARVRRGALRAGGPAIQQVRQRYYHRWRRRKWCVSLRRPAIRRRPDRPAMARRRLSRLKPRPQQPELVLVRQNDRDAAEAV